MELWLELLTGICLSTLVLCSFPDVEIPTPENVHWVSLDFKTILRWSAPPSNTTTYTVQYSESEVDWTAAPDCIQTPHTECDLTHDLGYKNSLFQADVQAESSYEDDYEELPHTYSSYFNPYTQSELSAVAFSVQKVAERSVTLNISDPLTSFHVGGKQLSIRDVLKKDLKYKVSYYKSGSTGKRDLVVDSNVAQIPNLDPGQSYCFMVAAFVPSRDMSVQQGAWSTQTCTSGSGILDELDLRTIFQAVFIPLVLLIVVVTVLVIYCRFCRRKNKTPDSQTLDPPGAAGPRAQSSVV